MAKKTYDEITRTTVPDPDGSWRPSPEQVKQAHEGFRSVDREDVTHDCSSRSIPFGARR